MYTKEDLIKFLKTSKNLTVIVSVTRDCVLMCRYCYARTGYRIRPIRILAESLLEKVIKEAFLTSHETVDFEWTGGEPMLAGKDFFKKVIHYQEKYGKGKKRLNALQTSGACFMPDIYDYLIDNRFSISVTLDGLPEFHDKQRPFCDGARSSDIVLKSINYLNAKQGDCEILSTLTSDMKDSAKQIFDYYRKLGIIKWLSNPYIYDSNKPVKEESLGLRADEYADYFIMQFDYWMQSDDIGMEPGHLMNISEQLAETGSYIDCTHSGRCLTNFINIDPDGNAVLCPKFIGYNNHILGNIKENTINEIISFENPRIIKYVEERLEAINRCLNDRCKYFYMCNSGCPYNSLLQGGDGTIGHKDALCLGKRRLYSHIDEAILSLRASSRF